MVLSKDKDTKKPLLLLNLFYNAIKMTKLLVSFLKTRLLDLLKSQAPLGVLAGIVPTTNPTSTAIFKSLLTAKTRNAIVFAFHPQAQKMFKPCSKNCLRCCKLKLVPPEDFIQWIEVPSLDMTTALIQNRGLATIPCNWWPRNGKRRTQIW